MLILLFSLPITVGFKLALPGVVLPAITVSTTSDHHTFEGELYLYPARRALVWGVGVNYRFTGAPAEFNSFFTCGFGFFRAMGKGITFFKSGGGLEYTRDKISGMMETSTLLILSGRGKGRRPPYAPYIAIGGGYTVKE